MSETRRDDEEVREMMALHAVGALSDDELRELEQVLAGRPDMQRELDALLKVASTMADAVSEAPPPGLRASVLDIIATTPQLPAVEPAESIEPPVPLAPFVSIDRARRRRWLSLGAVAAAIIAIVVGVFVVSPFGDTGREDEIAAVLEDPERVPIPMGVGELAGLSIVHSAAEDAAVLTGSGLPVPVDDRVYELWALRGDDAPERVDIFRPDDDGDVAVLLGGIDPASAVWAITEEPAGGSDTPTLPILAQTA